jgi:KDO2-lipid IV(A) lauroyltransferase
MSRTWRNLRWSSAYWISRTGALLGRYVPAWVWYTLAVPIADACYFLMPARRRVLEANLARVVGPAEAPAAARRVFRNFARYVIDFYQMPFMDKDALCRRMEFHDWRNLNTALTPGEGGIFVTLHLGQAEIGAGALAAYGHPVSAIADTLAHAPMDRFVQGLRRGLGMNVIPANKAKRGVLRCLSRGEVLGMMVDVVQPGDGVTVEFLGAPAEFSSAPARIAIRTGARVMPGVVGRDPRSVYKLLPVIDFGLTYETTGDEEADVLELTCRIARSLETYVRRFPDQWFAFRPVWALAEGSGAEASTVASSAPSAPATPSQPSEASEGNGWRLWALQLGIFLGTVLPRRAAYAMACVAGDLAYRFRSRARFDVQDNMRHVMPQASNQTIEMAAREAFRNVARYYTDLIRLPRTDLESLIGRDVRLHGFDRLKSRLDAGQGVVVATAHYGNPEIAVQVGAILGINMLVLAEPLSPPAFAGLMHRLRSTFKPRYVDVSFGAIAESLRHLRAGGCVAIACDRDIQEKGVALEFFGVETRLPLGAVELAARTGAELMPGYCHRAPDGGFDIYFEVPLNLVNTGRAKEDARVNARLLLARAEAWITNDPGQWMPLERIWTPLPEPAPQLSPVAAR